jgi:hypothetical protein
MSSRAVIGSPRLLRVTAEFSRPAADWGGGLRYGGPGARYAAPRKSFSTT